MNCKFCNSDISNKKPRYKNGIKYPRLYCSDKCCKQFIKLEMELKREYRNCINCNSDMSKLSRTTKGKQPRKFCSRSCAAIINNTKYPKRGWEESPFKNNLVSQPARKRKLLPKITCPNCHKVLKQTYKDQKYCSRTCAGAFKRQVRINSWITGDWSGSSESTGKVSSIIRNYLLDQANYRCTMCNWSEINQITGMPVLVLDHIDGDWGNSTPGNLRIICRNCDSTLPTFCGLNVGNNTYFTGGQGDRRKGKRDSPKVIDLIQ